MPKTRFESFNWFIDTRMSLVGRSAVAVYAILWRHANRRHRVSISHGRLSETLGVSKLTIINALKDLKRVGALSWQKSFDPEKPANVYTLLTGEED